MQTSVQDPFEPTVTADGGTQTSAQEFLPDAVVHTYGIAVVVQETFPFCTTWGGMQVAAHDLVSPPNAEALIGPAETTAIPANPKPDHAQRRKFVQRSDWSIIAPRHTAKTVLSGPGARSMRLILHGDLRTASDESEGRAGYIG